MNPTAITKIKKCFLFAKGLLMLGVYMSSVFFIVVIPFDLYQGYQIKNTWQIVDVEILKSELIKENCGADNRTCTKHKIALKNILTEKQSKHVGATWGDFKTKGSQEDDAKKFHVGLMTHAYKHPEENRYYLRHNGYTQNIILLFLSVLIILYGVYVYKKSSLKMP